ncbi:hypothetical protein VMCG_05026 [Cytospora schulzeri]|uniref:CoA-binding domain-containing protein n=1 Tax=Cytospora schulzeri TaxID=448051 RepID=A0A423WM55_9PEZI|nr:hypothetical protein VMCG_05026 [Valsa malicola]
MSTEASMRTFFSSKYFAVVGASSNTAKFGHKIFAWYLHHQIPATPINPTAPFIAVPSLPDPTHGNNNNNNNNNNNRPTEIPTVKSLSALPHPKETSVSIITPPAATLKVLQEAKNLGIPAVWLQPGTFDDEVLAFAREGEGEDGEAAEAQVDGKGFRAVVAGFGGGTRAHDGWCVLVDGERGLKSKTGSQSLEILERLWFVGLNDLLALILLALLLLVLLVILDIRIVLEPLLLLLRSRPLVLLALTVVTTTGSRQGPQQRQRILHIAIATLQLRNRPSRSRPLAALLPLQRLPALPLLLPLLLGQLLVLDIRLLHLPGLLLDELPPHLLHGALLLELVLVDDLVHGVRDAVVVEDELLAVALELEQLLLGFEELLAPFGVDYQLLVAAEVDDLDLAIVGRRAVLCGLVQVVVVQYPLGHQEIVYVVVIVVTTHHLAVMAGQDILPLQHAFLLARIQEEHSASLALVSRCSSDSVDVRIRIFGAVDLDNPVDSREINTSSNNVRRE